MEMHSATEWSITWLEKYHWQEISLISFIGNNNTAQGEKLVSNQSSTGIFRYDQTITDKNILCFVLLMCGEELVASQAFQWLMMHLTSWKPVFQQEMSSE